MKRLLVFVLLLVFGMVALKFAIGDEAAVRAGATDAEPQEIPPAPPGVEIENGPVTATISHHGELHLPRWRELPQANGSTRRELVHQLDAADSKPIGAGLQQLDDVTMKLFEHGVHVATIEARQAFVELGRDANGKPHWDEQKDFDLRETVLTTEPGTRLAGTRLDLGDARVHLTEESAQMTTLPNQRVTLTLSGKRALRLTGLGALVRLPRDQQSPLQRVDIELLREPVLDTDELHVQARGRLRYIEDLASGTGRLTLEDDVLMQLAGARLPDTFGGNSAAGRSSVQGDQFTGWLSRPPDNRAGPDDPGAAAAGERGMRWQRLNLIGAPAVIDAPGARVETPCITVLPGPLGEPFALIAHGGPSRVVQTELRAGSKQKEPVVGASPRRIHMLQPGDSAGALHRAFGWPRWTLRSLDQQQIVVFEGGAELQSGTRTVTASEGLRAIRRQDGSSGVVQGFGKVTARQAAGDDPRAVPLAASGDGGLRLVVGPDAEQLVLGPAVGDALAPNAWRSHHYLVERGDSVLRGVGACTIDRHGERVDVALRAPFDEIEADIGGTGALRRVAQLDMSFADRDLLALDAKGLPVRATLRRGEETVQARAPRVQQVGPHTLQLTTMPEDLAPWSELPAVDRLPQVVRDWSDGGGAPDSAVEVRGPRIDVHHVGRTDVLIDAIAVDEELPRIYARMPTRRGGDPTTVTCAAERLRVLPFLLTHEARLLHQAGMRGPLAELPFRTLGDAWLLVDRVREFMLDDERQGHVEGTGRSMVVTRGGNAALFLGDPDQLAPAVVRRTLAGRMVEMEGAAVRVSSDDEVRLQALGAFPGRSTFLAPTVTLREPGASGLLSHMRAVCRGDIDFDPDAIRFGGPVTARELDEQGDEDPNGMQIVAAQLTMQRQPGTSQITSVAGRNVALDWSRMSARGARIDLDLLRSLCTVQDPAGASVDLQDGRALRSTRITVQYDAWAVSMARGRVWQRSRRQEGSR